MAFIASPCYYLLTINGRKVTDTVLNNAWTDCEKTCLYATYDIKQLLKYPQNAIGVCLGNGWNALALGYTGIGLGEHLFSMQILLEFEDGSITWVTSSLDGWSFTTQGPILFNSIYHGETYDATKELDGWDKPGYNTEGGGVVWYPAVEFEPPKGKLKAQSLEPCRVVEEILPKAVYKMPDGSYSIDYGRTLRAGSDCRHRVKGDGRSK
jgi:alpha-L-rhamnosidase